MNVEGISPNPKTVEAVKTWKEPGSIKEIQSFLGLCSYYRQYIANFSHIAAPMTRLTKKNVKFQWDGSCQKAFEELKEKLCSAPILAYPKPGLKYLLDTDASDVGIGGVLSQVQDGKERVIAYASKRLSSQQERYSVTRRELLAVITFVNHFRHYLLGQKFLLRTDHGSLRWLFNFRDPRGQVARWLEFLAQYDFDIEHRPGSRHKNADSLSRKDFEQDQCGHVPYDSQENQVSLDCEDDWQEFYDEVDDVTDLGSNVHAPRIKEISEQEEVCLRAFTRAKAKSLVQDGNQISQPNQENSEGGSFSPESMFLPIYTFEEIQLLQREDADLGILHDWMDKSYQPSRDEAAAHSPAVRKYWLNSENIVRKNGILYQRRWEFCPAKQESLQLLVPKVLRNEVIRNHHDTLVTGHFGINKTYQKMQQKFYWYQMRSDTKLYIRKCDKCNRTKTLCKKPRAKLRNYVVGYPLNRIGIDVMGPLPLTKDQNKFILVIGDYFTRWMEAYSLPSQHAEIVAQKLVHEFISRFGTPLEIHSDQGRNFESQLFKEVLRLL